MERSNKVDVYISIAILSAPVILTFQYFLITLTNIYGLGVQDLIQNTSMLLVGFIFIVIFPKVFMRNSLKIIFIYLILMSIFGFHYLIFEDNRVFIAQLIFNFFTIYLLAFVFSLSIKDWKVFHKVAEKASLIIFLIGALFMLMVIIGVLSFEQYSISLSYYMLMPCIIFLNKLYTKVSLMNITIFVTSFIIILALGSRGTILCVLLFIIIKSIVKAKKITFKKLVNGLALIALISIISFNLNSILQFFLDFFYNQFGIYSRTLDMFISDTSNSSGRDTLYSLSMDVLSKQPIEGLGIAGDRVILQGTYVHNILLEVLLNFGVIMGTVLILIYIFVVVYCIFFVKYNNEYIYIWLILGIGPLLVSGSYFTDIEFWILNGLLISTLQYHTKRTGKNNMHVSDKV